MPEGGIDGGVEAALGELVVAAGVAAGVPLVGSSVPVRLVDDGGRGVKLGTVSTSGKIVVDVSENENVKNV